MMQSRRSATAPSATVVQERLHSVGLRAVTKVEAAHPRCTSVFPKSVFALRGALNEFDPSSTIQVGTYLISECTSLVV